MSNLRDVLIDRASREGAFLASAFAIWRKGRPDSDLSRVLGCSEGDLWRLELARRPRLESDLVAVRQIAESFHLKIEGLIQVLRFAETISALAATTVNSESELLLAARDDRRAKPSDPDNDEG